MSAITHDPGTFGADILSVALMGPAELRRREIALAVGGSQASVTREFAGYPGLDDVPRILESSYDVVIIDLDGDLEHALELVEAICGGSPATVMVSSSRQDPDLLMRSMRAGAREFLTPPFSQASLAEALVRAAVRRPAGSEAKKAVGKLLVFAGAKGGSGTTTVAANFAVALAQASNRSTVLIDLDLPLGAAALNLGLTAQFSTVDALQDPGRVDSKFFARLLVKHDSGLKVLPAPDKYSRVEVTSAALDKLLAVARMDSDFVVADVGTCWSELYSPLLDAASTVYLVTQVGIVDLRNANRIIQEFFVARAPKLQVVLNRFTPHALGIDEESIAKALTLAPAWKIPNDDPAVQRAQNSATPLVGSDSAVSRVFRRMARQACGLPLDEKKGKRAGVFGLWHRS